MSDADAPAEAAVVGAEPRRTTASHHFDAVDPTPGCAKPDPILVADGVRRTFGGLTAVDVDHVEVQRGAITALIGPNGAGKTTFFNLLTGFDQPDEGHWTFDGEKLDGLAAHQVARRGMVRTFQLTKSLARLSVIENIKLGATDQRGERIFSSLVRPLWRRQEQEIEERAEELLVRFKLDHMRDEFAGSLSGGQRKLLEMARALMVRPRMVMLDEPMAGVNPALTQSLLEHVKDLRDRGDDGDVRRARHGRRARHHRLGRRDGRGPHHRRGHARPDQRQPAGHRRLPRRPPRRPLDADEEQRWLEEAEAAIREEAKRDAEGHHG